MLAKVTASPKKPIPPPTAATTTNLSSKESCPRCKQGFFCSDHGNFISMLLSLEGLTCFDLNIEISMEKKLGEVLMC